MTISIDARKPGDIDVVSAVREATEKAKGTKRGAKFSFSQASPTEAITAIAFGLYLAYAVARLPSVFKSLAIPRLPMVMMIVFLGILGLTVPIPSWKRFWHASKAMRLVTLLCVLSLATVPLGIYARGSLDYVIGNYSIALAVFYCAFVFLRDRANLRRAVALYVLCVGAVAGKTLLSYDPEVRYDAEGAVITADKLVDANRVTVGDSLDPNDFGAVLTITLPLALWLGVGGAGRRIFWSAIALLFCAAVVLTASRGALLGFGAVALALLGVGARGWRRILTMIMLGLGVLAFFAAVSTGQLDRMTDFDNDDYNITSSQGRLHFWKQGMVWMIKRPQGSGVGNFPMKFEMTHGRPRAAHSTWVQYGMELGVTGLAAYILLCVTLIRGLLLLRQRAIYHRSIEDEAIAGHFIAMVVGLIVTGTFLSNAYAPLTYMTMGLAAAALLGTTLPELPAGAGQAMSEVSSAPGRRIRTLPATRRG